MLRNLSKKIGFLLLTLSTSSYATQLNTQSKQPLNLFIQALQTNIWVVNNKECSREFQKQSTIKDLSKYTTPFNSIGTSPHNQKDLVYDYLNAIVPSTLIGVQIDYEELKRNNRYRNLLNATFFTLIDNYLLVYNTDLCLILNSHATSSSTIRPQDYCLVLDMTNNDKKEESLFLLIKKNNTWIKGFELNSFSLPIGKQTCFSSVSDTNFIAAALKSKLILNLPIEAILPTPYAPYPNNFLITQKFYNQYRPLEKKQYTLQLVPYPNTTPYHQLIFKKLQCKQLEPHFKIANFNTNVKCSALKNILLNKLNENFPHKQPITNKAVNLYYKRGNEHHKLYYDQASFQEINRKLFNNTQGIITILYVIILTPSTLRHH